MLRRWQPWATVILAAVSAALLMTACSESALRSPPSTPTMPSAAGSGPARPTVPAELGVSMDGELYFQSDADIDRWMSTAKQSGFTTVRLGIPWHLIEPQQGQYSLGRIDYLVNTARRNGLKILGILYYAPGWANNSPGSISTPPTDPSSYAAFAKFIAQRYRDSIAAYEIWNEANSSLFFAPQPDAAQYVRLLRAAYPAIKAVAPQSTVLFGGLGATPNTAGDVAPPAFLEEAYRAGAQGFFDALAFHPYQYTTRFTAGSALPQSPLQQLVAMRRLMIARGDAAKQVWCTEYGLPTSVVNLQNQASFIADLIRGWHELPYGGPIYLFTLRDRQTGSTDPEATFGLFTDSWQPRPAVAAARTAAATSLSEAATAFAGAESDIGDALSPVFPFGGGEAQERERGVLFRGPQGFVTTPTAVAATILRADRLPVTPFANGWQDLVGGFRVFYSKATGVHVVGPGIAAAWTPALGLATSGEAAAGDGVRVLFERGMILWRPGRDGQILPLPPR